MGSLTWYFCRDCPDEVKEQQTPIQETTFQPRNRNYVNHINFQGGNNQANNQQFNRQPLNQPAQSNGQAQNNNTNNMN